MDRTDRSILAALQKDGALSNTDLADRVGLSTTPCWRRVRLLEEQGYIRKRVALLDREKLRVGVTVFVSIKTARHDTAWLQAFADAVAELPEIVELYRMSGEIDYMMKVTVPDITAYDRFYKTLIDAVELSDVSSAFAMEEIKNTTELPLDYLTGAGSR